MATGIGQGSEEDLAGQLFHFPDCLLESAPVLDGLTQGVELLWAEGDGNGLSSDLAGPLITGTRGPERGTIQH